MTTLEIRVGMTTMGNSISGWSVVLACLAHTAAHAVASGLEETLNLCVLISSIPPICIIVVLLVLVLVFDINILRAHRLSTAVTSF